MTRYVRVELSRERMDTRVRVGPGLGANRAGAVRHWYASEHTQYFSYIEPISHLKWHETCRFVGDSGSSINHQLPLPSLTERILGRVLSTLVQPHPKASPAPAGWRRSRTDLSPALRKKMIPSTAFFFAPAAHTKKAGRKRFVTSSTSSRG